MRKGMVPSLRFSQVFMLARSIMAMYTFPGSFPSDEASKAIAALLLKNAAEQAEIDEKKEAEAKYAKEVAERTALRNSTKEQKRDAKTKAKAIPVLITLPGSVPAAPVVSSDRVPGSVAMPVAASAPVPPPKSLESWEELCYGPERWAGAPNQEAVKEECEKRWKIRLERATTFQSLRSSFGKRLGEGPGGSVGYPQNAALAFQYRKEDETAAIAKLCGYNYGEPHGVQLATAESKVRVTLEKARGLFAAGIKPKLSASVGGYVPGTVNLADKERLNLLGRRPLLVLEAFRAEAKRDLEVPGTTLWHSHEQDRLVAVAKLDALESNMLKLG